MTTQPENSRTKLLPRNVAALRRGQSPGDSVKLAAGNSVSTRLEAGVGNCFPGLECDLRNLERRFFPYLEVNVADTSLVVVGVDAASARADSAISGVQAAVYEEIAKSLVVRPDGGSSNWTVTALNGDFGPLGKISDLDLSSLQPPSIGTGRRPTDTWTAVRLLKEGSDVQLLLSGPTGPATLAGKRTRYFGDDGALAEIFLPGEMTQSLCSPWTHDFRDCACYYWASNHPDIVQPVIPATQGASDPRWNAYVDWERADRGQTTPPPAVTAQGSTARQLSHYEINNRWQQLHIVLEGRERIEPLKQGGPAGLPYQTDTELLTNLRLGASIELAVMQEYLCAAFSMVPDPGGSAPLAKAVRASRAEIMRVAIGEMRHLRVVNEVLASIPGVALPFVPALRVASKVPTADASTFRPKAFRALSKSVLEDFIAVESAAHAIDQLYSNVRATFEKRDNDRLAQAIASIIADGQDHLETFRFVAEWLAPFEPSAVRAGLKMPTSAVPSHVALQAAYKAVLEGLFTGYSAGLPQGAPAVNGARQKMVQPGGLMELATAVADAGFLVVFEDLADPRFAPL